MRVEELKPMKKPSFLSTRLARAIVAASAILVLNPAPALAYEEDCYRYCERKYEECLLTLNTTLEGCKKDRARCHKFCGLTEFDPVDPPEN
jgi:hypothetical protein